MKFIQIVLFAVLLIATVNGQGLRGLFDQLTNPFGLRDKLFNRAVAELPENERLNKTSCGCRLGVNSRIVGGIRSETIPWQALFVNSTSGKHFCGGTIVNNYYIITTAHCTDKKTINDFVIKIGLVYADDQDASKVYGVEKIFQGSFTGVNVPGDIAIVKLSRPIVFVKGQIEPACINLIEKYRYPNGLMATGFGTISVSYRLDNGTYVQGEISNVNKKAYFYQDFKGCRSDLICINSRNAESACNGDSGGPLHYTDEAITTVEAGASFVRGTRKGIPFISREDRIYLCTGFAGYSRFSYYASWIKSIVGNEYCTTADVAIGSN